MEELLQQLAGKLGIATRFSDGGLVRKDYEVDDAVVRYIAERLGYKAGNRGEVENRWLILKTPLAANPGKHLCGRTGQVAV